MREILAKWLVAVTGLLIALACLGFAAIQNPMALAAWPRIIGSAHEGAGLRW